MFSKIDFLARNAEERQRWLDALQEARDLHTDNYALLQHVSLESLGFSFALT